MMLQKNGVYCCDCFEGLKKLKDSSVDLLVTDPPYGISLMCREWDKFNDITSPRGAYEKVKGFKKLPRNKTEGMYDFFLPIWKKCFRILKPGAFAFVMCASRSDVMLKQMLALSDAGFELDFTPIYWANANGFPKSHNVAKELRKKGMDKEHLAGCYAGYRPKPAVEVIIVAMKPLAEKSYSEQPPALAWSVGYGELVLLGFPPFTISPSAKGILQSSSQVTPLPLFMVRQIGSVKPTKHHAQFIF